MKWFTRIFDMLLGISIAGLAGWIIYLAMYEMIFEAAGWYDLEDWLWSIGGTIVFLLIFYAGIKLIVYAIKTIINDKKILNLSKYIVPDRYNELERE